MKPPYNSENKGGGASRSPRDGASRPARGPDRGARSGPPTRTPAGFEPRRLAVDLVAGVLGGKLLDYLLDDGPLAARYQALEPRDRGLARAITGITLRRFGQLEDAIKRFLDRPIPETALKLRAILAVAAAQLMYMGVADHAAVQIAVEIAGREKEAQAFKGLANAILRKVAGAKASILAEQDEVGLNTPSWLLDKWTATYGAETAHGIAKMGLVEPSLDLTVKSNPEGWAERLQGVVLPNGSVRVVAQGAVEKLEGYEDGEWWVQDAAATLPVRLLGQVKGKKVADLCAAPGGKTAQLAFLGADVLAIDVSGFRLARLSRNLHRLQLKADTMTADLTEWIGGPFDAILLDAPCSATGTLRRHPDGTLSKKPGGLTGLVNLQRKLLDQAIRMVKPGGLLVYSTCSLEPEEGEDQIRRLMLIDAPVDRVPVTADEVYGLSEIITPDGDIRTLPTHLPNADDPRLGGLDGFFAARLRRRDG